MSSSEPTNINPSALIYPPPIQILDDDLHKPTTVTIHVKRERGRDRVFPIPRALVCARSKYFTKAFKGSYLESAKKKIVLAEDKLAYVRLFVNWLYTGQLYMAPAEHETSEDEEMEKAEDKSSKKRKLDDDKENEGPRQKASRAESDLSLNFDHGFISETKSSHQDSDSDDDSDPETDSDAASYSSVSDMEENARRATKRAEDRARQKPLFDDGTYNESERQSNNPVTWPWDELFDLYVFADEFDTRPLRNHVMELIQVKTLQLSPLQYAIPSVESIAGVLSQIPASSKLYRFLVDMYARGLRDRGNGPQDSEALSQLPSDFLAECFIVLRKRDRAFESEPNLRYRRAQMTMRAPHNRNKRTLREMNPCAYHEHPKEESDERLICKMRWDQIQKRFLKGAKQMKKKIPTKRRA